MTPLKTGDRVKIVDREMTAADVKSGLFYDYFRNLTGTVERIYEDKTICVRVDLESLPEDVGGRHIEVQESVKNRWINGLGQEQRERLSQADKTLTLSYNILVGAADAELIAKGKPATRPKAEKPAPASRPAKAEPAGKVKDQDKEDKVERRTQADIEKAEEEYLRSLASRQKGGR